MTESESFGEGLVIQKASPADAKEILDFVCGDFLKNEPLTEALNGTRTDMEDLFKDLINVGLSEPILTYVVRSKEDGSIAALRLTGILNRPTNHEEAPKYQSYSANMIAELLGKLENKTWDILPPTVDKLATWIILSVDHRFTRRGIAQKLVEFKLDEIRAAGCTGIVTEATANNSQKLFAKLGYKVLHEILHKDWKNEQGQVIVKCNDSTDRAQLNYLDL